MIDFKRFGWVLVLFNRTWWLFFLIKFSRTYPLGNWGTRNVPDADSFWGPKIHLIYTGLCSKDRAPLYFSYLKGADPKSKSWRYIWASAFWHLASKVLSGYSDLVIFDRVWFWLWTWLLFTGFGHFRLIIMRFNHITFISSDQFGQLISFIVPYYEVWSMLIIFGRMQ